MLDSMQLKGAAPACPTLVMDNGSRQTALLMALPGVEPDLWPRTTLSPEQPAEQALRFLKEERLPMPGLTLVCTMGGTGQEEEVLREERIRLWKEALRRTKGRPDLLLKEAPFPGGETLLKKCRDLFGPACVTHSGVAAVLAGLGAGTPRERSWREGITLIWAGYSHTQAFMVYQETIFGLYEQHAGLSREALLADLAELRLNWLPDEQVRSRGGHGCICGDMPQEAEGFRPTWILGPERARLEGCGRLLSACGDDAFERCFGLLSGLKEARA